MPSISLAAKACKGLLRSMTLQAIGALGTACSVVEGLAVVPGQIDTGPLHLDETARLPHQVGEGRALGVVALDAHLQRCPSLPDALMAKGAEEPVAEDLRLTLFVPAEVLAAV